MGKKITREKAEQLCKAFQEKNKGQNTESVFYDADSVSRLLGVESKKGILVRFATLEDGKNTVVLQSGDDFEEFGSLCPPNCPPQEK